MKFNVNPVALCRELSQCRKVMTGRGVIPVLGNFLFEMDGDVLTVTGSDSENTIRRRLNVEMAEADGMPRCCVDAGLLGLLQTVRDGSVSLHGDPKSGVMHVNAGRGVYEVPCVDAAEYPLVPSVDGVSFKADGAGLSALFGSVSYAMSSDSLRMVLNGTLMEAAGGRLTAVATDANVLARGSVALSGGDTGAERACIVPAKTVNVVSGLIEGGEVEVRMGEKNVLFAAGGTEVIARLIDGKYPNYRAVIPSESPVRVVLERGPLMESLRRMVLLMQDGACITVFTFKGGSLNVHLETGLNKNASDVMDCDFGGEFEIGFNAQKMMNVLKNIESERVEMRFSEPNKAMLVVPEGENEAGVLGLCMPCFLEKR